MIFESVARLNAVEPSKVGQSAAVPDLVSMLKRRSRAGMYPMMAAIMGTFQIVWVYYGILIASRPVIVWNVVAVLTNFLTVGAYRYFGYKEKSK